MSNQPDIGRELSKAEIHQTIFSFSGPIIAELMLMSLIGMVNLSMVGHLGASALSSAGLTNQPIFISLAFFQSFNIGATALVSRFIGAKDYREVKAVVIQTMIVSTAIGLLLAIAGFIFSKQIVIAMGAQADTVNSASMYMKYMAVGILFQAIPTAVTSILRGAGNSKIPMQYNIASNIINVIFGFPLIYGLGSLSGLGLEGAAIASTLAKLTACLMAIYAIFNSDLPVTISRSERYSLNFPVLKRIMNIGISAAGEQFFMRFGLLMYSKIIAELGTDAFAAHQICLNTSQLLSNVINGLSMAASSFTGRSLGSQKPGLAEAYCNELQKIGLVFSAVSGLVFFFAGYPISRIYTEDAAVTKLAAEVLRIMILIVVPQNYLSIVAGCLRGAGDTRWPLISSFIGMVFARVCLAILFVKVFHWGLVGAWTAAIADQSVRSVLIYYRFKTGKWKNIII